MIPWRNMRTSLLMMGLMLVATLLIAGYRVGQLVSGHIRIIGEGTEQRMPHPGAQFFRHSELVANPVLRIETPPVSVFAPPACGGTIPCVPVEETLISKAKGYYVNYQ